MKNRNVDKRHTIIFFDIRNFSEHRWRLADEHQARLLTKFVKEILNSAVELLEVKRNEFKMKPEPILNHTGDGFLLILRGYNNPLLGLIWISEFRQFVSMKIREYEKEISAIFRAKQPTKLGFGIGAHYGLALRFYFKDFANNSPRKGFIGSALNVASRVEQCTKDHVYKVLLTEALLKNALKVIPQWNKRRFDSFLTPLGKHRLRGFKKRYSLYGFKAGFHQAWKQAAITIPARFPQGRTKIT
jgi:class 3 adenylate cyclase